MGRIAFRQIPMTWRVPGVNVEFDWTAANRGLVRSLQRLLIMALHPGGGFPAALDTPILIESYDHAVQLAGRASMLAQMVKTAKAANRVNEMWAILVAAPDAGVAAHGSVTFAGPASAAGTVPLLVDGRLIQVGVAANATAATIATATVAAINADPDLAVTAAVDGVDSARVNITCDWKGVTGNGIDLRVGYWRGLLLPSGVTATIAAFAGGTGVPDLADAIDALATRQYHHVVTPFTDAVSLAAAAEEMERRWDAMVQMEGQVWTAAKGSLGTLTTLGTGLNSDALSVIGIGKSPTNPWIAAAAYGAACAKALGIDPARQLRGIELKDVLPPEEVDQLADEDRNILLYKGIATCTPTVDGQMLIERAVTSYQTNVAGLPDPSRLDVMTVAVASAMRETLRNYVTSHFPDYKLADDGTNWAPTQRVMTPKLFRGHVIHVARLWEEVAWVESVDAWKDEIAVERPKDTDPNRLDTFLPPDIINNAMEFAFLVQPRI